MARSRTSGGAFVGAVAILSAGAGLGIGLDASGRWSPPGAATPVDPAPAFATSPAFHRIRLLVAPSSAAATADEPRVALSGSHPLVRFGPPGMTAGRPYAVERASILCRPALLETATRPVPSPITRQPL